MSQTLLRLKYYGTIKNADKDLSSTSYRGKSTGQDALELWMYNLKTTEIIANYNSHSYSGPVVKPSIMASECGPTGIAYSQEGGDSQLAPAYGMAADQVHV